MASRVTWTTTATAPSDPVTVRVVDAPVTSGSFAGRNLHAVMPTKISAAAANAECASSKGLKRVDLDFAGDQFNIDA